MIAKAVKGTGFRGALAYDLAPEKGALLDTNMAGETPRELAAEFGAIRALRPTLGKAVLHVSLTAAPGEQLSDDQWREIGQRYLAGMGFSEHQYVLTRHTDTAHDHIHLVANRIGLDGQVVSDSRDYPRQEQLMREIEREYGLQEVAPSLEAERHAPTKGELERTLRTGEVSTRQQLQVLCDDAAQGCDSFTAYQERLEAVGVAITPTVQRDGATLSGLQYRLDGVTMKGSDLGKAYAAAGIQNRGISYEQDRDYATVERCRDRAAAQAEWAAARSREPGRPEREPGDRPPDRRSPGADRAVAELAEPAGELAAGGQRAGGRRLADGPAGDRGAADDRNAGIAAGAGDLGPGDGRGAHAPHAPDQELGAEPAVSASGWARTGVGGGAAVGAVEGDTGRGGGDRAPGRGRDAALPGVWPVEQDVGGVGAGAGGSAALSIGVGGADGRRAGRDGGPEKSAAEADQVAAAADLAAARAQLAAAEEALERTAQQLAASAARIERQEARQRKQERERVRQEREQERQAQRDRERDQGAELEP